MSRPLQHIGLFEGIGGFSIAGHWAGWETIAWCEWAKFPQQVLSYHFPTADQLHDVTTADFTVYRGRVDVLTGGFPCQPFSHAGKRRGTEDDRHLWPHMLRAIQECRPTWVVGENVAGLASMAFPPRSLGVDLCATVEGEEAHRDMEAAGVLDSICADLEREGYDVQPIVIPACAVNAPHRRDRIWIIGYNAANCADTGAEDLRSGRTDTVHGPEPTAETSNVSRPIPHASGHGCQLTEEYAEGQQLHRDRMPCYEPQSLHGRGAAANAHSGQQPQRLPTGQRPDETQSRTGMDGGPARHGHGGNAADTDLQRPQECVAVPQPSVQERQHRETHIAAGPGGWQDFPTQRPVCGGNDGISDLLDTDALFEGKKGGKRTATAAYNHWRNETIKAYGNAIVPQVFYEIAKAIDANHPHADE